MNLQVLVSTVNGNPKQLIKKMNINSDAIIINQCDKNDYEELEHNGYTIKVYSFNERGVGLSRNNALMRATADIILLADDDEVLTKNYRTKVLNEFKFNPDIDMFIFNIKPINSNRKVAHINESKRISRFNGLRYGAPRYAFRLNKVKKHNISFSQFFGGGSKYGSGEDSIFLMDCIKRGLNIYSSKINIAEIDMGESSWFKGYTEKYYFDKGALFARLFGKKAYLYMLMFIVKHHKEEKNFKLKQKYGLMIKGYKDFRNNL